MNHDVRETTAAELPNDNPALWVRAPLVAPPPLPAPPRIPLVLAPLAKAEPRAAREEDEGEGDIEIVDELEFDAVPEAPSEPPPPDAFAQLVGLLADVARESGGAEAAAVLVKVLGAERMDDAIPQAAAAALVGGGILASAPKGLVRTEAFTRAALGWSRVLRGESDDMGECGARMLDEWAADVVARVLGAPARAEQLRRELRRRGVAAFGLLAA